MYNNAVSRAQISAAFPQTGATADLGTKERFVIYNSRKKKEPVAHNISFQTKMGASHPTIKTVDKG